MNELNDCFNIPGASIKVEEAISRFLSQLKRKPNAEHISLNSALGRILAEKLVAKNDVPPTNNSAVDGYLVYFDDLKKVGDTRLKIGGSIAAGHPLSGVAQRGEALKIYTGASIPTGENDIGPDTIYMLEDVLVEEDQIILPPGIKKYSNLRKAGEDIRMGTTSLCPGHCLRPQDISMAAALGYAKLLVFKYLKVAIFSTGDEVQDVGEPLDYGKIYDSNRYSLISMLKSLN